MVQLLDVRSIVFLLVIAIQPIVILIAQEEMNSGRLNFDIRMSGGS